MKLNKLLLIAGAALAGMCAGLSGAQAASADVSNSFTGTYDVPNVFGTSPYATNSMHRVVINGATDTMCIDGTLYSNPVIGHVDEPTFVDPAANLTFYLASKLSGNSAVVNVYDTALNKLVAQLYGPRTGTSTDCVSIDEQSVFDLALSLYPALFTNGSGLGLYEGYRYKYFADSKIYVGLKNGRVYLMGGMFGTAIVDYGPVGAVLSSLKALDATMHPVTSTEAPLVISAATPSTLNGTLSKAKAQFESGSSNALMTTYNNTDPYCRVAGYTLTNSGNGKVYSIELTFSKENRSVGVVRFKQDGSSAVLGELLGPVSGISVDINSRRFTFTNVIITGTGLSITLNGTLEYTTNFVVANRAACG